MVRSDGIVHCEPHISSSHLAPKLAGSKAIGLASVLLHSPPMSSRWLVRLSLTAATAAGCAADTGGADGADWVDGKADGASAVGIAATDLKVNLSNLTGVATLELESDGH